MKVLNFRTSAIDYIFLLITLAKVKGGEVIDEAAILLHE